MSRKPVKNGKAARPRTARKLSAGANRPVVTDFEALLGQGNDLWATDAEFEAFLEGLRRRRRADLSKPEKP